ncbi:TPA: colicin transporter [Salmonella enterica subsp. enterica serovar Napoli]|nr:colicin transporter [Salmonella enterica subsp. enterica serovar Napoli]
MGKSKNDIGAASAVINEVSRVINDVNQKIAEKQKQKTPVADRLKQLQEKKDYNGKYPGAELIKDNIEKKKLQEELSRYESDINALKGQLAELNGKKQQAEQNKAAAEAKKKEDDAVKDAVKFTEDFYKEVFKVYGEKAEQLAKLLADQAKGKKVRNVEDALRAYEKHKANINKKINAKDREAIAKALESVDVKQAAKNISRFGKGLGYTSLAIDAAEWAGALKEAIETDNWRQFFVKTETIAAGMAASAVTGFAFSIILGGPVGLLGYGLIMAGIGALIDDKAIEEVNKFIGV